MKLIVCVLLLVCLAFGQNNKDFFKIKGTWEVTQVLHNGEELSRINKIQDLFEGNGLLSYWYDESGTFMGSDVRTYDSKKDQWKMTWYDGKEKEWKKTRYLKREGSKYIAISDFDGSRGPYKEKITFYNLTADSYEWKMEYLPKGRKKWFQVMSYKATRKGSN